MRPEGYKYILWPAATGLSWENENTNSTKKQAMITQKIKLTLKLTLASLLLMTSLSGYAQVASNHSLSMTLLGLEYSYEQALASHWSLIGRAGVVSYGSSISMYPNLFQTSWTIAPDIVVEPRYYTSMDRRERLGRDTHNNSSDFISLRIMGYAPDFESFNVSVTPMYGIRRSETKHWFHEFAFGPQWTIGSGVVPYVSFRLGYIF